MRAVLLALAVLVCVACNPPPSRSYSTSYWDCVSYDAANPCPAAPSR